MYFSGRELELLEAALGEYQGESNYDGRWESDDWITLSALARKLAQARLASRTTGGVITEPVVPEPEEVSPETPDLSLLKELDHELGSGCLSIDSEDLSFIICLMEKPGFKYTLKQAVDVMSEAKFYYGDGETE